MRYIFVLRDRLYINLSHDLFWLLGITRQSRLHRSLRVLSLFLPTKLFTAKKLDEKINARMPILRSKYPDLQIPDNISWPDFVFSKFDKYGDRAAIVSILSLLNNYIS